MYAKKKFFKICSKLDIFNNLRKCTKSVNYIFTCDPYNCKLNFKVLKIS